MNRLFIGFGVLLIILSFALGYYTGNGLQHNFSLLRILSNFSSFLMIVGFMVVGILLIYNGIKEH